MNKIALVTGASTGIGFELSRLLARDGYHLFVVARGGPKLAQAADHLRGAGSPSVAPIEADLGKADAPQRVVDALGGITPDVLINNAGFGMVGRFAEIARETQLEMIQVNVTSLVDLTRSLLPGMLARRSGRILNVASTAAFQPGPLMAIYYATKSFVLHFTEAIAQETEGSGVSITALCPGPTTTEFQERSKAGDTKLFKGGGLKVMAAREVAEIGYRAMLAGEVVSVAGLRNQIGVEALRLAPRSIVRKMVYKLQQS